MPRCCILGGSGFIGVNLADRLAEIGWQVVSLARSDGGSRHRGVIHHRGSFANSVAVARAVDGCDVVFHLIGSTPARVEADPAADLEGSVVATLRLLDANRSGMFGKLVFVSSGGTVYGSPQHLPIDESVMPWPNCSYGVSKLAIERYLHVYHHLYGLDYAIARVSNPYGPYQRVGTGQGVVASLLDCALARKGFVLSGDGSVVRDFVYVGDVVDALVALASHRGAGCLFNIGSAAGTTLNVLIDMIEEVCDLPIERLIGPARAIDVPANVLDTRRAAVDLGWRAETPLRIGLAKTLVWMMAEQGATSPQALAGMGSGRQA